MNLHTLELLGAQPCLVLFIISRMMVRTVLRKRQSVLRWHCFQLLFGFAPLNSVTVFGSWKRGIC